MTSGLPSERLPGEDEVDFSARMAKIQSEMMAERKRDADVASQAGYAAESDDPLAKFRRREDIQSLAVAISDDAIICGIRPNGVPERDPISPSIVEVEFVPAATLRGAVERAETAETEVARLRGIIERRGTVEQLAQLDHPGGQ